jgi:hypothetical protein
VNGLLPFGTVGESYFFDDKRGMLSAVGVSSVNLDGKNVPLTTLTYRVTREYPSDATLEDLVAIRNGITEGAVWTIRTLRAELAYKGAGTNSTLAAEMYRDWTNAMAKADAAFEKVSRGTSKPNVLLFRWNTQGEGSAAVRAGSLFSAKAAKSTAQGGYGLVAGFRTSTLYVGADLVSSYTNIMPNFRDAVKGKFVIPTFSISASNLIYFAQSDLAREVEAKLKASYSQFGQFGKTLTELDQFEFNLAIQRLESLSNSGIVRGPARTEFRQFSAFHKLNDFDKEVSLDVGWATFYSVLTRIDDVIGVYRNPAHAKGKGAVTNTIPSEAKAQ